MGALSLISCSHSPITRGEVVTVDEYTRRFPWPRRRRLRRALQGAARVAFPALMDLEIIGRENMPERGPLLVVANHFSFLDPAIMVRVSRWPIEFLGGFRMPNAPPVVTWIPKVWGYFPVFRGTGSRLALRAAETILAQDGVVGMYPEGGNWATVLRPARPGISFLAARTGARILPMGFHGLTQVFPRLKQGRHARVTVRIGEPCGPFRATGRGRERRRQLDEIGHEIMGRIANLIPPEQRGFYSDDPAIREAAKGTEIFPWDAEPEE